MPAEITPEQARAAVLAGKTVRLEVRSKPRNPEDPVLLVYVDREYEFDHEPQVFSEAIGGWSEGIKECVCEVDSDFLLKWLGEDGPGLTITDEVPIQRESQTPVSTPEGSSDGR